MSALTPFNVDPAIRIAVPRYAAANMKIPCLINGDDLTGAGGAEARALGLEVWSSFSSIYPAFLPADWDLICKISQLPCVYSMELSR